MTEKTRIKTIKYLIFSAFFFVMINFSNALLDELFPDWPLDPFVFFIGAVAGTLISMLMSIKDIREYDLMVQEEEKLKDLFRSI